MLVALLQWYTSSQQSNSRDVAWYWQLGMQWHATKMIVRRIPGMIHKGSSTGHHAEYRQHSTSVKKQRMLRRYTQGISLNTFGAYDM